MSSISRRRILAAASAALVAPYFIPASALGADGRPAPSNRIAMGCIGLGGRGTVDMNAFLGRDDVQIVALCDVDAGSDRYEDNWIRGLAPAVDTVARRYGGRPPTGYSDFRQLLERKDIDAVCIGTPDHWHAAITVMAAACGKDVYCEKPMSLTVGDGRAMVDAVHRYGRIFQCGSQRRSSPQCRFVCELVRNGRLGKLQTVRVGLPGRYWLRKNAKDTFDPEPVPAGFDYDLWLGPAPEAPYTYNRCHWNFRWNLDYSGGNVTDWGAHMIDMAHWGMGAEHTGPVEVEGKGNFPSRSEVWNAADSFEFTCTYADGVKMIVKSGGPTRFEGTDGQLDFEGNIPPELARATIGPNEIHLYDSRDHHGNFIECVKSRRITAAPAETAHRSITPSHLGNIAMQVGRKLRWDPQAERFLGDDLANRMLARAYRGTWKL